MSSALPANLPAITNARLPETYQAAKQALSQCSAIDECKQWADKAEALASYAKQAKDDALRTLADRIQARAIRRCSELLRQIEAKPGPKLSGGTTTQLTRQQAAKHAGLSRDQYITAMRVGRVPAEDFESAVESDNPPTITALAEAGKKARPLVTLAGIDPKEFALSTDGQDQLRHLAEFASRVPAAVVARGARPSERQTIRQHIDIIDSWLDQLFVELED